MSEKIEKITIYLPKHYADRIKDYAKNNQLSLTDAVRNLIKQHIDRFLKPSGFMVPDPYTNKGVPFDMKLLNRIIQHEEDRKRKRELALEKAKAEGRIVDFKKCKY